MGSIERPTLQRIPVDAPIEVFIEVIKRDGGCICTDYVTPEDVATANAEVKPYLDADKPWQVRVYNQSLIILLKPRSGETLSSRDSSLQQVVMAQSHMSREVLHASTVPGRSGWLESNATLRYVGSWRILSSTNISDLVRPENTPLHISPSPECSTWNRRSSWSCWTTLAQRRQDVSHLAYRCHNNRLDPRQRQWIRRIRARYQNHN